MKVEITDKDRGWSKSKDLAGKTIQVKVQSVAKNSTGKRYAWYVEHGTRFKGGRPFVANTMEEHNSYRQQLVKIMDRVLAGENLDRVLDEFGETVKRGMRQTIEAMGLVGAGKPQHLRDEVRHAHKLGAGRFPRGTWT